MNWLYTLKPADWFAAVTAIATSAGVPAVVLQLRMLSKQLQLYYFLEYARRYQAIVLQLPADIRDPNFKLAGRPDVAQIALVMQSYFDMCFEQWQLHRNGSIGSGVWSCWRKGMQTALTRSAVTQAWGMIQADKCFDSEFAAFVNSCIPPAANPGRRLKPGCEIRAGVERLSK